VVLAALLRDLTPLQQAAEGVPPDLRKLMHPISADCTWPHDIAAWARGAPITMHMNTKQVSLRTKELAMMTKLSTRYLERVEMYLALVS
jgi:hypothetical protein